MTWLAFLLPFVLLGIVVVFIAFSGGPSQARQAYLTKGSKAFRIAIPIVYIVLGIAVPAVVIAARAENEGATGRLRSEPLTAREMEGKQLFRERCWSCHTLAAANARGVTGPNLDKIGEVTESRVINAIKNGGSGQNRMPAGLLEGSDSEAVAVYLSKVAGK